MTRADSCRALGQIVGLEICGRLLHEIDDPMLRELAIKLAVRARELAIAEDDAAQLKHQGGKIVPGIYVGPSRTGA